MLTTTRHHLLIIVLLLVAVMLVACSDEEEIPFEPEPHEPAVAETADAAVAIFLEAYGSRDLEAYTALLSEDFNFVTKDGDRDDRTMEIAIATRMFGGEEGASGIRIADISIPVLDPTGVWAPTPANDPDFGSLTGSRFRTYNGSIRFSIAGQNLVYIVQGPVMIYAQDEGDGTPQYRLVGFRDLTLGSDKATENHSWSAVRGLFD